MARRRIEQGLIIGLGLLVVAGAALLGGVYPAQQRILAILAVGIFALALLHRITKKGDLTLGAPFWILVAVAGFCFVQLLEFPQALLGWLSPRGAALVAYTTEGLGPPHRRCLSLDPPATALALAGFAGLASLAGAAALLLRDGGRALLFLWTVNFGGISLALVALVQRISGSRAVFWVYEPHVGGAFVAPFVNVNHAGAFYGALTFLNLGLALHLREARPRLALLAITALPASLVVASGSRGAIVATCLGAILFLAFQLRSGELDRRRFAYWVAGVILAGTVALPASATLRQEFGPGTKWEALDEDGKVLIWKDALAMVRDYPLTGIGRGAFRSAFPAYQVATEGGTRTFSHPENLFVQWLVEIGLVPGLALLLLVGVLAGRYLWRARLTPLHVVALCPVLVLVLQNLVDFNLEFPGTAFMAAALLGTMAGLTRGRTRRVAPTLSRRLRALALVSVTGLFAISVGRFGSLGVRQDLLLETSRLQSRLELQAPPSAILSETRGAIRRHPSDYYLQYLAGLAALRITGEQPLRHFNRALTLNPRSALTQHQVGRALVALGLYQQALGHFLQALRLRQPLAGNYGRDLFSLLQQIWNHGTTTRQILFVTACESSILQPGRLPLVDCSLANRSGDALQARPLMEVIAIDPRAGRQLALWLERVGLRRQAMLAWAELHRIEPARTEPIEALTRISLSSGDLGWALHSAERWVQNTRLPEAFGNLAEIQRRGGLPLPAEATVDAGLKRYPEDVRMVALKAELLAERGELLGAQEVLVARLVGSPLDVKEEIRLISVRIALERKQGNRLRTARLESRLGELQRLVKAGYRGTSPRQE